MTRPLCVIRRHQVQVLAQEKKQQGSSQRREVFAGLLATAAVVALPKPAQAEERSATLIAKLCASNPTCKSSAE